MATGTSPEEHDRICNPLDAHRDRVPDYAVGPEDDGEIDMDYLNFRMKRSDIDNTEAELARNVEAAEDALEAYLLANLDPQVLAALQFNVGATKYALDAWKRHLDTGI